MLTIEEGKNERSIIKALHDCLSETAHHVLPESALSNERKKIQTSSKLQTRAYAIHALLLYEECLKYFLLKKTDIAERLMQLITMHVWDATIKVVQK